jgi:hypothetical protein
MSLESATFFTAMSEGGAALLGLLFVAVSLRRTESVGEQPREAEVLADGTFFALADGFVVSSAALYSKLNVAYVALGMSAYGLVWAARGLNHLRRAWARSPSPRFHQYRFRLVVPNLAGLLCNAAQIVAAVRLVIHPGDEGATGILSRVVLGYYGIALLRAWTLVGGAHYGPRAALSEAERAPTRVLLREHHLPPWPHVRHGLRGPSPLSR